MSTARASRSPSPRPAPEAGQWRTVADLLKTLGDVPASRVRWSPSPGTATEQDLLRINESKTALCELDHGTLVEKTVGYEESEIAGLILTLLNISVLPRKLGIVLAPDGPVRLLPSLVRLPDVCFISWDRFPGRKRPKEAILSVVPDLVVEVLSKSNSKKEMARKLRHYLEAGVRVVWYVDPRKGEVKVFTSTTAPLTLTKGDTLDGGDVLPGFALPVRDLFERD